MTHRRPEPSQAAFEQTLRRALRLAADSIEPAPDGLARIRTKIAAGPPAPVQLTGWAAWRSRYLTGLLAALAPVAKYLDPVGIRLRYAFDAVVERFRPDSGVSGWIGWLRPAAALATTLLVVTGASWAIAALPQSLSQAGNSTTYHGGGPGGNSPSSGNSGNVNGSSGPVSQSSSPPPTASPSCNAASATAHPTANPLPSQSSGSSPTGSPSPPTSTSPSPSPSATPTDTTSSSGSPSPTDTPAGQGQSAGSPGYQAASPEAKTVPVPTVTTPKARSSLPPTSPRRSPCAG